MKKLSRLDLRSVVERKAKAINEAAYDVPTRRDAALNAAMANIEKQFGPGAIQKPMTFDEIMVKQMHRVRSASGVQDIGLAYDLMIKHAQSMGSQQAVSMGGVTEMSPLRQAVGEIAAKTSLDKRFIRFHLNKAVNAHERGGLTGLPTGSDLVKRVMAEKSAKEKEQADRLAATTEMIGGTRVTIKPAAGRGKGRPTYGHTSIGTRFAPDGMPDEEACKISQISICRSANVEV